MKNKIILGLAFSSLLGVQSLYASIDLNNPYVRADVGASFNKGKTENLRSAPNFSKFKQNTSPLASVGLGYQFAPNMRSDLTLSMLTSHKFHNNYSNTSTTGIVTNTSHAGRIESQVALLNAYFDFNPYSIFTPYVTVGAGVAFNKVKKYGSNNTYTPSTLLVNRSSSFKSKIKRQFAWKAGAGLTSDLADRVKLDVGYSYMNLGKAQSNTIGSSSSVTQVLGVQTSTGPTALNISAPSASIKHLHSHQITAGVRYAF